MPDDGGHLLEGGNGGGSVGTSGDHGSQRIANAGIAWNVMLMLIGGILAIGAGIALLFIHRSRRRTEA